MSNTRQNNILGASLFRGFFLLIFVTAGNGHILGRVFGGRDAEESAYPYQASLRVNGVHMCGGSLVNNKWILTAAHCIVKFNLNEMVIVLGSNNLLSGGVAYEIESSRVYPMYDKGERRDDIGLIKMKGYVEYTEAIKPIGLPMVDVDESDCIATFTGWGNTELDVPNHNDLQVIELTVMDTASCHSIFSSVNRGHLCTLTFEGVGVCYGDSGSPLVADGVQIAIASWGSPCARGYPDVHTRVYKYTQWILSIIQ